MQVEIIMPKMGESIQEGTILRWIKNVGDKIEKDETILEISTDKVDSEIPSPVSGVLAKVIVKEQETVLVGTVIAYIETDVTVDVLKTKTEDVVPTKIDIQIDRIVQNRNSEYRGERFYSPLVRKIAHQENIAAEELTLVIGSGSNGRVTKQDILNYIENRTAISLRLQNERNIGKIKSVDISMLQNKYPEPQYRVVRMDNIQRKMAEHMVRSVNTAPHVTVVDEVDMTEIVNYRFRILERFEKESGIKLTLTPFFAFAVINALKEYPIVNSSIEGDAIIFKNFINLGIAVASPSGLIVPVVRNAEGKDFVSLTKTLTDIALRARSKKLVPEEIKDGTFSITNYGVFGNIIGTPIINQPQSAILGIGAIKKRAVVLKDEAGIDSIKIRSMVYLTLSFDHRVIDGATGGQFIARVKWHLENFNLEIFK